MILLVDLCYRPGSLSRDEFVGPVARIVGGAGREWKEIHVSEAGPEDLGGVTGIILCGTALKDNLFAERIGEFSWIRDISGPGPRDLCRDAGPLPCFRGKPQCRVRDWHDPRPGRELTRSFPELRSLRPTSSTGSPAISPRGG